MRVAMYVRSPGVRVGGWADASSARKGEGIGKEKGEGGKGGRKREEKGKGKREEEKGRKKNEPHPRSEITMPDKVNPIFPLTQHRAEHNHNHKGKHKQHDDQCL